MMYFLNNHYEYRNWMLRHYFLADEPEDCALLTADEIDDCLFDMRPQEYPCVAMIVPSANSPAANDVAFIYREQIVNWATKMGA